MRSPTSLRFLISILLSATRLLHSHLLISLQLLQLQQPTTFNLWERPPTELSLAILIGAVLQTKPVTYARHTTALDDDSDALIGTQNKEVVELALAATLLNGSPIEKVCLCKEKAETSLVVELRNLSLRVTLTSLHCNTDPCQEQVRAALRAILLRKA